MAALIERLKALIAARGTHAKAVSLQAGLSATYVSDLLAQRNLQPGIVAIVKIAQALGTRVAYLTGEEDDGTDPTVELLERIPLIATAETGAFRAMPDSDEFPTVPAARSRAHPDATHFAVKVADRAMDACTSAPLVPGMIVQCVDMDSAGLVVESNRLYCLRRTADGGKTWETLIRRARVFAGETQFVAESHQRHDPIVVKGAVALDTGVALKRKSRKPHNVVVIGLVHAASFSLE